MNMQYMVLDIQQKYEIITRKKLNQFGTEIAKTLKINIKTVYSVINKYEKNHNVDREKGSDRKKKLSLDQEKIVLNEIKTNKLLTSTDINDNVKEKDNTINVSDRTIRNIFNNNEMHYKYPKSKPLLTNEHKAKRLQWAQDNKNTDWTKILFSDETSIWKRLCGRKRWVDESIDDREPIIKYPLKRHIWGCISYNGAKNIQIFDGIMDAEKYIDILENNLLDIYDTNMIFQQDNDPKHTAKKNKVFFNTMSNKNNVMAAQQSRFKPN